LQRNAVEADSGFGFNLLMSGDHLDKRRRFHSTRKEGRKEGKVAIKEGGRKKERKKGKTKEID